MNDDRDIKDALHRAAGEVQPRGTTEDVLARVSVRRGGGWAPAVLGAAAVLALVVGVATWAGSRDTDPPPAQPTTREVTVFYSGGQASNFRLHREVHEVAGKGGLLQLALDELYEVPRDPDYLHLMPKDTTARIEVVGGVARVDLWGAGLEPIRNAIPEVHRFALQAIVETVNANSPKPLRVMFLKNGAVHGEILDQKTDQPWTAGDPDEVMAPVQLDVTEGAVLNPGDTVSGRAAAFEATVVWSITDAKGEQVEDGFTTAQECCTLSPYSFEVPDLPPGDYTLTVAETDPSGGEGRPPASDSKSFTIE